MSEQGPPTLPRLFARRSSPRWVLAMLIATLGLGREPVYGDGVAQPADPTTNLGQPPVSDLQRAYLDRLSPYLPTYFIYSPKIPEAKFQYSLRYRVLEVPAEPHRHGLYLGYTQLSLWNLGQPGNHFSTRPTCRKYSGNPWSPRMRRGEEARIGAASKREPSTNRTGWPTDPDKTQLEQSSTSGP